MQLPRILNPRFAIFSGSVLFILWLWIASDAPSTIKNHLLNGNFPSFTDSGKSDVFDFPPTHSEAMREVCRRTQWNSSLIFTCDNNHGGVGHVRNSILNCVRYAIGAGGALVMPQIKLRIMENEDDHHHDGESAHGHAHGLGRRHGPGRRGMDYLFDAEHFKTSLKMSCPELKLIDHLDVSANPGRRGLQPESLFATPPTTGIESPEEWQVKLYTWIDRFWTHLSLSPVTVDLAQSFLQYPTHSDGHDFAHQFGNIMKFRKDARELATKVLSNMVEEYDLHVNVAEELFQASFLGVHLKTDEPNMLEKRHVVDEKYTRFDPQAHSYLSQSTNAHLPLIYVASGNISAIQELDDGAIPESQVIISKYDLLVGKDRERLDALRWDQRALVDYLVLLKASDFGGVGHSSFSWNVALKRHEMSRQKGILGDGNEGQRWKAWSDGMSTLYGVIESYVESSQCMWP